MRSGGSMDRDRKQHPLQPWVRGAGPPLHHQTEAAPRFAVFEAWAPRTMVSGDLSSVELSFLLLVRQHRAALILRVVAKTAPPPLLRFQHQSALHRIAVHVMQLLDSFALAPDVEVVEALLPDVPWFRLPKQPLRSRTALALRVQHVLSEPLFEDLHHRRGRARLRLADEHVEMLGHDHIADYDEAIALAGLFEETDEERAPLRAAQ